MPQVNLTSEIKKWMKNAKPLMAKLKKEGNRKSLKNVRDAKRELTRLMKLKL